MTSSYRKLRVSEVPCQKKKKASGVQSISNPSSPSNSPPSTTSHLNGLGSDGGAGHWGVHSLGDFVLQRWKGDWFRGVVMRKKEVREAVISDETEYTETETDCTATETEASDTDTSKLGVGTGSAVAGAIVTDSTLVELRDQYGEDWLRSGPGAGDKLHTLLGIQEVEGEKHASTIIQYMVVSEGSKSWSRRLSDEVPDAIEHADVVLREEKCSYRAKCGRRIIVSLPREACALQKMAVTA